MWQSIVQLLSSIFSFGTKVIPDDKIREDNHEIRRPRLTARERTRIYDNEFRRLKNHPEIDIATDVAFINPDLHPDDQKQLVDLLTDRLNKHWSKRKPK